MQAFLDSGCRICDGWESLMRSPGFPAPPQACQRGHSQHLEHLLFYGAEPGAQNASGNTALHICALYNKVCSGRAARALLLPPVPQPPCALCSVTVSFIHSFTPSFIQQVFTEHLPCAEDQVVSQTDSPSVRHAFPLQSRAVGGRSQGIQVPLRA